MEKIGPYKIIKQIGAGGMGQVFKGVHEESGEVAAVKLLAAPEEEDANLLKRFRREIVSASRLSHDNIVRLFDSGEQDGQLWYSMECVDGQTLGEVVADGKALPSGQILSIGIGLCKAFVYLHSRGMVHRDIKPSNIMVDQDGEVKLVDFGLVKSKFSTNITVTGIIIGTPAFMSPEMLQGREVDHRSDIFQLGLVLYYIGTGLGPFGGINSFDLAQNCLTTDPALPTSVNPELPEGMEQIIMHCLEKKADKRYQSSSDILSDIRRVASGLMPHKGKKRKPGVSSRRRTSQPGSGQTSQPTPVAAKPAAPSTSRSAVWIAGTVAAVALIVAAVAGTVLKSHWFIDFDVRAMQTAAGMKSAEVTWESQAPYPTRVLFRKGAPPRGGDAVSTGEEQEVVNARERDATRHSVRLSSLEPGAEYFIRVVYPDGELSRPRAFKTARPGLRSSSFRFLEEGTPVLSFATHTPVVVSVDFGGDSVHQSPPDLFSTDHQVILTGSDIFGRGAIRIQCTDSQGEQWIDDSVQPPDIREMARALEGSLSQHKARIVSRLRALAKADRERALKRTLIDGALPEELEVLLDRFVAVGPLFFSSLKPSLEEKIKLYEALSPLDALERYAARRKLPLQRRVPSLLGSRFGLRSKSEIKGGEQIRYRDSIKVVSALITDSQVENFSAFGKATKKLIVPFQVRDAAAVEAVEIIVYAVGDQLVVFEEDLHVKLNDGIELIMRRDPSLPANQRHMTLVHGFDPRALVERENQIELTLHPMPGLRSSTELFIREVKILLKR